MLAPLLPSVHWDQTKEWLLVPRIKSNAEARAFLSWAPSLWNSLPLSVLLATSGATFKKYLKTCLFDLASPPLIAARLMTCWCYGTASSILLLNTDLAVTPLSLALINLIDWKGAILLHFFCMVLVSHSFMNYLSKCHFGGLFWNMCKLLFGDRCGLVPTKCKDGRCRSEYGRVVSAVITTWSYQQCLDITISSDIAFTLIGSLGILYWYCRHSGFPSVNLTLLWQPAWSYRGILTTTTTVSISRQVDPQVLTMTTSLPGTNWCALTLMLPSTTNHRDLLSSTTSGCKTSSLHQHLFGTHLYRPSSGQTRQRSGNWCLGKSSCMWKTSTC